MYDQICQYTHTSKIIIYLTSQLSYYKAELQVEIQVGTSFLQPLHRVCTTFHLTLRRLHSRNLALSILILSLESCLSIIRNHNIYSHTISVSNEVPEHPVISPLSGCIYERRLIEKYINEHGVDPMTEDKLSAEQLIDVKSM